MWQTTNIVYNFTLTDLMPCAEDFLLLRSMSYMARHGDKNNQHDLMLQLSWDTPV